MNFFLVCLKILGLAYDEDFNSKTDKELNLSKYPAELAFIVFFLPVLLLALLILALLLCNVIPGANSPGVGWGITFAFIGIIALFGICLIIYLILLIISYFIKSKEK